MARYTIELGRLVAMEGFDIGLTEYPIYDDAFREPLNAAIIEHFFFREIGLETGELFKRFLNRKMAEIMPYYNELYKSTLLDFNPLYNVQLSTDGHTTGTVDQEATDTGHADSTGTNHDNATSRSLFSQTPQMQLSGAEDYATNITDNVSETDTTTTGVQDSTSTANATVASLTDFVNTVAGYSGQNPASAIKEFRSSLLNVNLLVFDELEPLFMQIWDTEIGGL